MFPLPPIPKPMHVSDMILRQLGGNKFVAMTGAKDIVGSIDSLTFKIPKSNGINAVRTRHNILDLYDMEFMHIKNARGRYEVTTISKIDNVYAEDLQKIFTEQTGLDTHL